jgi:hypothetical protein
MSYVFWNNKGGVGKSTLTFQLASTYARENQEQEVYVIDLSPQCDVSRMVLGGGFYKGEEKILDIMRANPRKTILQYLSDCYSDVPTNGQWPRLQDYILEPNKERNSEAPLLPSNLRLVCGDFDLERALQTVSSLTQPPTRGGRVPTGPSYSVYLLIRSFVRHLSLELEKTGKGRVFIDTDPYYNVLSTHLGLFAADDWITLYSPGSQASQYAVYRSLEFLYHSNYGLSSEVIFQNTNHPQPWHDSRGNILDVPSINVPRFYMLLSNMTRPYSGKNETPYSTPQLLHKNTMKEVKSRVTELKLEEPEHDKYIWNLQRLGLICDYNGIDIHMLEEKKAYPQPEQSHKYPVNSKQQLEAYQNKITEVSKLL